MARGGDWTAEEDADLSALTIAEFVAKHPVRTASSVNSRRYRLGLPSDTAILAARKYGAQPATPGTVSDHVEPDDIAGLVDALETLDDGDEAKVMAIFEMAQRISDISEELAPSTVSAEYTFDDGLPVGVAFTGDWHLGGGGVDLRRLQQDIATIGATDGLYAIGMGDYVDGVSIHSKAVSALYDASAIGARGLQNSAALIVAKQAMGKWLAIIDGNHDAWSERHASISCTRDFANALDAPYFHQGGGAVFVNVGSQRYNLTVRHNAPGNSRLNTSNAQRRLFDEFPNWENCDVITLAHYHFNDLHIATRKGGKCVYMRTGTAKVRDHYSASGGFTPEYGIGLVILYPDKKEVLAYRGDQFEEGLFQLEAVRERYAKGVA